VGSSLQLCGSLLLVAAVLSPAVPRDKTLELRARFETEVNPVHKAKLMQELGASEFKEVEKYAAAKQLSEAAKVLDQYHSEVEECSRELDQSNIDAAKKPSGFKQLQISVREALRRLDRLISTMTADEQVLFRKNRDDLEELNSHLLQELFPGGPTHRHHLPIP
jgi:transcription termination factor NusB